MKEWTDHSPAFGIATGRTSLTFPPSAAFEDLLADKLPVPASTTRTSNQAEVAARSIKSTEIPLQKVNSLAQFAAR